MLLPLVPVAPGSLALIGPGGGTFPSAQTFPSSSTYPGAGSGFTTPGTLTLTPNAVPALVLIPA